MIKYLTILSFLTSPFSTICQSTSDYDTIIYYGFDLSNGLTHKVLESKDSALSAKYIKFDSLSNRFNFISLFLHHSHGFIERGQLLTINPEIRDGIFERIDDYGNYVELEYKGDSLIQIISYKNENGDSLTPVYDGFDLDQRAFYKEPGIAGFREIHKKIRDIIGDDNTIFPNVIFTIEVDGSVSQIEIHGRSELNVQITHYLESLQFYPAQLNGQFVRQYISL